MQIITFVVVDQLGNINSTVSDGTAANYPVGVSGVSFLANDAAILAAWASIIAGGTFTDGNSNLQTVANAHYWINGQLDVNGRFAAGDLNTSSTGGGVYINPQSSSTTGSLDFTGDLSNDGNFTSDGNTLIGGTIGVTGAATLSSTLSVTGASNLIGNVDCEGTLNSDGNATVGGTLTVTGAVDCDSTFNADGNSTIGGTLGVTGAATLSSTLSATTGTLTATTNQLLLGTTNVTTISSVAPAAGRTVTLPDAGAASTFVTQIAITAVSTDIALTKPGAQAGTVFLTKAGIGALTLAPPTSGTDDNKRMTIISGSANAHVITSSVDGFNAKGSSGTLTFGGAIGDSVVLRAYLGHWYTESLHNVTPA